jgi:ketosteroid isomerase-like protein
MRTAGIVTATILIASLGCAGAQEGGMPQVDEAADIAAVEAVLTAELATIVAGDVAGNVALLTDEAIIMPPDDRPYERHEAEAFFTGMLEDYGVSAGEYVSHDIEVHGDVAIDYYRGELTMTPAGSDEAVFATMKGIHVLKRQADGSWKISHDIWNANEAAEH